VIAAAWLLGACNTVPSVDQRIASAKAKAEAAGFTAERMSTRSFVLQAFHRGLDRSAGHWHVYLEGDGLAFLGRHRLSPDPTPVNPIGLDLALADTMSAVLYLGRPCQYRPPGDERPCPNRYWSSHRFAEEVVEATLVAIRDQLAEHGSPAVGVTLIGYSGGGALAALLAARMPEVRRLVTVAAPLDLAAWTRHHGVTSLEGSLDPLAIAQHLTMPQAHFSGRRDNIVPAASQSAFLRGLPPHIPVHAVTIDGLDHICCWGAYWAELLKTLPAGLH
jgi:pimeloyl-ACP methyl ester carboxylesterase